MMKVIINADDLGMSPTVNEATFELMSKGLVTSATILTNGPFVREAIAGSARFPSCSFGVHLNLTEFVPMGADPALGVLVNSQGEFNGMLDTAPQKIKKTKRLIKAIANEWSCQIESVLSKGVKVSHLDSHQHVHTIPLLFPALKLVQAKFGIRRVRLTRNVFRRSTPASIPKRFVKRLFNLCLRNIYQTRTTAAFLDFTTFYECVTQNESNWPSAEVMVHPGSVRDTEENRLLMSDWREKVAGRVQLISYNDF